MLHLLGRESLKNPGGENERLDSESNGDDQTDSLGLVVKAKPIGTFLTF